MIIPNDLISKELCAASSDLIGYLHKSFMQVVVSQGETFRALATFLAREIIFRIVHYFVVSIAEDANALCVSSFCSLTQFFFSIWRLRSLLRRKSLSFSVLYRGRSRCVPRLILINKVLFIIEALASLKRKGRKLSRYNAKNITIKQSIIHK